MRATLAVLTGLVVIAGICIGGWQLGWWMNSYTVSRTARIYQQSYGAQSAYVAQVEAAMTDISTIKTQIADPTTPPSETQALQAQLQAVINQACASAANITPPLPASEAQFVSVNCP